VINSHLLAAVTCIRVGRKTERDEGAKRGRRDSEGDGTNKKGNGRGTPEESP